MATGKIAVKLAEAINYSENSVLHAVASRSEDKAGAFAEKYGAVSITAVMNSLQMIRMLILST